MDKIDVLSQEAEMPGSRYLIAQCASSKIMLRPFRVSAPEARIGLQIGSMRVSIVSRSWLLSTFSLIVLAAGVGFSSTVAPIAAFAGVEDGAPVAFYGDVYLEDQREWSTSRWQAVVRYLHELDNPYFQLDSVGVGAFRSMSDFWALGATAQFTRGRATTLNKTLAKEFRINDVRESFRHPESSYYAVISLLPLYGHVNVLGGRVVQLEAALNLGAGAMRVSDGSTLPALQWAILPRAYFSDHWGVELGVVEEIARPFSDDRAFHLLTSLGVIARF